MLLQKKTLGDVTEFSPHCTHEILFVVYLGAEFNMVELIQISV